MKSVKRIVNKMLSRYGYIHLSSGEIVRFENFQNLVRAYELRLNELMGDSIHPNEMRAKLLARLWGTPPSEAYFIVRALQMCKDISGDVCEFGVAQGETSALIANEILLLKEKKLHLFDSFKGLPKPSENDKLKDDISSLGSMDAYVGLMAYPKDMVLSRMNAISFPSDRWVIHEGFIEELLHKDSDLPEKVSFAYVDFDLYNPIRIALEFLHGVTSSGAIIIVDDYDFFSTGAKTAVDEFIADKNSISIDYECYVPNSKYGHFAMLTKKG